MKDDTIQKLETNMIQDFELVQPERTIRDGQELLENKNPEIAKYKIKIIEIKTIIQNIPDFKVMNPVCPDYTDCRKKIRLLDNQLKNESKDIDLDLESRQHLKLKTDVKVYWDLHNFKVSNKPLIYKMEDSRNWFIFQGWSRGDQFIFFMMHHSREILEEVFYYKVKIYGAPDPDGRSMIGRCAPMGIGLEDVLKNGSTLNIDITDLEKICHHPNPSAENKYRLCMDFSVLKL